MANLRAEGVDSAVAVVVDVVVGEVVAVVVDDFDKEEERGGVLWD